MTRRAARFVMPRVSSLDSKVLAALVAQSKAAGDNPVARDAVARAALIDIATLVRIVRVTS